MALFFRGAVTSSPIKSKDPSPDQSFSSLDISFLSDSSYECCSTNPLTGSVCVCRRSPRLLANGYYVLTEDSITTDNQGNVTLTADKTNISYKENIVRIFRRRRKGKRSLASLLCDVSQSCQSWLEGSVFGRQDSAPSRETSAWLNLTHVPESEATFSFSYDYTEREVPHDKMAAMTQIEESYSEACLSHEQFSQSLGGLLDVPPPSICLHNSYTPPTDTPPDGVLVKAFLLFILTLCLCTAIFSRWLMGGVAMAMALVFVVSSLRATKAGTTVRWSKAKTEDITSRNE
ncbi:transmembrane protein 71 [Chanos chanos]|uniref:Transmembrane protein 71 n=1 Tax=Chanos chanos TaxID=29144 RepID=A0A6J2VFY1_CHACN|nr:transmembrane protein 71 [Chanos chanos]